MPAAQEELPPAVGLQFEVGVPAGAVVSLALAPAPFLRIDGGATYNLVGLGVRAGATLAPWRGMVTPTVRGEIGHAFEADASLFVSSFGSLSAAEKLVLGKVSASYASALVGLDIGRPGTAIFFIRGGMSWYRATANDYPATARSISPNVTAYGDVTATGRMLSAQLGVLVYVH